MSKYTHIIWDWNGTLLNDLSASLNSVNDMLDSRNMPKIDADFYKECIGVPIRKFYDRVFNMEKEDYSVIIKQYNEGYLRHLPDCGLTDGAREAIEYFCSCGMNQAVVSSSNNNQLCANIAKYKLDGCFDAVLGSADFYAGSKIDRAKDYIAKTNGESGRILVVGDLEHDADMAKELGADCVLLTSGHEHISRLKRAEVALIDDLYALIEFCKTIHN